MASFHVHHLYFSRLTMHVVRNYHFLLSAALLFDVTVHDCAVCKESF